MTTTRESDDDISGSDLDSFEMPETVLCIDTICNICDAEFLDEGDLKLHITQVHLTKQSRSRYCKFCSCIFASLEEYARHISDVHILNLKCCKYCMRAFTHVSDVRKHERKHLNSSSKPGFSCSNCTFTFKTVSDLEEHEYTNHIDCKDGVLLNECYSLLSSFLNIKAPLFLQSLGCNHVYTCATCKLTTSDVEYYMQHLQQKNCRSFVCDKCCSVFRKVVGLKKHFASHLECHNKIHEDLQLSCEKCNKIFNFKILQQHVKECQAVKCASCDLVFETVQERVDHQSKHHQTMFSIKICKYCHREFVGQVALNKHVDRSHKKDLHLYKYFCIYCNDIFNHPKKLFSHFFSKHKDLKPFTCKICDKTFKLRKQFTLHIKLDHQSQGILKFDENFHVFFIDQDTRSPQDDKKNEKQYANRDNPLNETESINNDTQSCTKLSRLDDDIDLVLCPTETEADQTDIDKDPTETLKRKRKIKTKDPLMYIDLTIEEGHCTDKYSDDEPLTTVKRRVKQRQLDKVSFPSWHQKSKEMKKNRRKFTCKICKKYCYTYQNFNHHMSLHQTHENKKCIKCPKVFKSKDKLSKHIIKEHSSSKLTETLKSVLERRKNNCNSTTDQKPIEINRRTITERFLKTIKKVDIDVNISPSAKVTPIVNKLSVKKFIENFTPDTNESNFIKNIYINNSATIKPVNGPHKPPLITLTKYKDVPHKFTKLKQPQRFKDTVSEPYIVTMKIVESQDREPKINFVPTEQEIKPITDGFELYENNYMDDEDSAGTVIPDVAEEIMLEGTEEIPKQKDFMHKIVIPNLPETYKDVHIAHLLPEAPYYKIVKIEEVLKEKEVKEQEKQTPDIKLPDGTKLISVNPLAHLLGDKQVEITRNKYYKPKQVNFEQAVVKALMNSKKTVRVKKKRFKIETEQ